MSQIIEDAQGYHIIRVTERVDAHTTTFEVAQSSIKKKLIEEQNAKIEEEYYKKLRERVPVWTVFDGDKSPEELTLGKQNPKR